MSAAERGGLPRLNDAFRRHEQGCALAIDSPRRTRWRLGVAALLIAAHGVAPLVSADHAPDYVAASSAPNPAVDVLERLGIGAAPAASEEEFLQPDAAFALSVAARNATSVIARWELADTYYLYRDKFRFTVTAPATIELGAADFPPGKLKRDDYFGEVEVYYGAVEAVLPIERRETGATELTLDVRYQGCTDKGLCYPPVTKTVTVSLPAQ